MYFHQWLPSLDIMIIITSYSHRPMLYWWHAIIFNHFQSSLITFSHSQSLSIIYTLQCILCNQSVDHIADDTELGHKLSPTNSTTSSNHDSKPTEKDKQETASSVPTQDTLNPLQAMSNALIPPTPHQPPVGAELLTESQQVLHRNVIRISSGPNSELRQRRPFRNPSYGERARDFSSALSRRNAAREDPSAPSSSPSYHSIYSLRHGFYTGRMHSEVPVENDGLSATTESERNIPLSMEPLLEMGFTRRHINMALRASNGQNSMDTLVSWLLEHPLSDAEVGIILIPFLLDFYAVCSRWYPSVFSILRTFLRPFI